MREVLPRLAWDHPVTLLMSFCALVVVGLIAVADIPLQMMPDGYEPRFLWVSVPYPNGSPLETDELVVRPVEAQLGTVSGISKLQTTAGTGRAEFEIEFHPSVDMDEAYNAVVDRLERALPELPEEVERYWIYKFDPNDSPIVWAGVSLPETVTDENHVVERVIRPRLERIPGVASLDAWGITQRVVYVDWDRERLLQHGINLGEVQARLAADNFQMPGGRLEDRGLVRNVRSFARLEDVDALRRYPIGDGLVLEDIATIEVRNVASASISRIDGKEAVGLGISRESSANTVTVAEAVREAFAELEGDSRVQGAKFHVFFDQGELVSESVWTLQKSAAEGGLFSVLILLVFLREWRMTTLIASGIPFTLLITVSILYFRGDSLNLLSLMGLMLSVGMVVDNAIVVVETIYRRRAEGASPRDAAIEGTGEVNLAIVASTATSMVVFLPLILMSENAEFSFFMGVLGFPLVFAHAASLGVALLFAPLATRYVGNAEVKPDPRWLTWLAERYERSLGWILKHKFDAGALFVAMLLLTIVVPMQSVGCSDDASENMNDFTIRFSLPPQASVADRDAIARKFETFVEEHCEAWGVRVYRVRVPEDESMGRLTVHLESDGPMPREEVMKAAREELPNDVAGVKASIGWEGGGDDSRSITVAVHGQDMDTLRALGAEVARRVETVDGVLDAQLDFQGGGADEIRLRVDRESAGRYGLTAQSVGQTVAFAMRGSQLEPLRQGEHEMDVVTRFEVEDRADIDTLGDFPLWSPGVGVIPLRSVTEVEVGRGPSSVFREDGRTAALVTADLAEGTDPEMAYGGIASALDGMLLPDGYSWQRAGGPDFEMEEDRARNLAMILSIVFVFLIMGMLFESLVLPLAIITTVPMAMMGAWWGLWLTGTDMDMMAGVGLVILIGVIVNNGIVLVDQVGQMRADGLSRDEALVLAGRRRLRPILMTALTTIIGLVPMATGDEGFIGIPYAPLGRTVMAGMIAGTLLTLLYVPYMYSLLDDLRGVVARGSAVLRAKAV